MHQQQRHNASSSSNSGSDYTKLNHLESLSLSLSRWVAEPSHAGWANRPVRVVGPTWQTCAGSAKAEDKSSLSTSYQERAPATLYCSHCKKFKEDSNHKYMTVDFSFPLEKGRYLRISVGFPLEKGRYLRISVGFPREKGRYLRISVGFPREKGRYIRISVGFPREKGRYLRIIWILANLRRRRSNLRRRIIPTLPTI